MKVTGLVVHIGIKRSKTVAHQFAVQFKSYFRHYLRSVIHCCRVFVRLFCTY